MSAALLVVEGFPSARVGTGQTLLEACEEAGIPMETECGGFAACNSCRVRVRDGADRLSPLADEEEPFLDRDDQRLGCQACILGDVSLVLDPGMS